MNFDTVMTYVKPTPHSIYVLDTIQRTGHEQLLLSSTRPEDLVRYMQHLGLRRFFPDGQAIAVSEEHEEAPDTKEEGLEKYLAGREFSDIILIGDSPSDMTLTKVCGGTTVHYTHPYLKRRECTADHKMDDLRQVLRHA
jgi:phosphoglycolate phosphatase-like HAD superfamily hydrolase